MVLHRKVRKMIYDVYCFMKREADNKAVDNLKQCMKRTAEATKCSVITVRRIVKESKSSEFLTVFRTPGKNKRNKQKPITGIDSFDQGVIKRIIHNFHITEKELPTIGKLRRKLQDDLHFQGSAASLRRIIKNLGFKWKATETNRKILIEQSQIRFQRIEYLRKIKKYREEGRPIIYTDESYVDSSHASHHSWTDGPTKGIKKPISKGSRLVIEHAGGEAGFVPNALLTFKAGTKSGDYHDNMNSENYERWLRTKLMPNLPPPNSVVVVDNASYHNKQLDAAPASNTKKADMQTWLSQKGIEYEEYMLKPELYNLIKKYKEQFKKFSIDEILNEAGHSVLRLPPYHPDLNPIEMAWSQIKGYVASKNVSWNLTRITDLVNEKVNLMGATEWGKLCTKVKEIEADYSKSDHVVDIMTETFIIRVGDDDSDSNNDESLSDDSDDDEMATSSTNTASSSGFHVTYNVLMEGVSILPFCSVWCMSERLYCEAT
ncbi:uncharacterized protein LOC114356372 [Ostrinia furnacalis]|uniref:uncharacterized protein LOC114356372 n=1 Tax=Ostrinia furnacalis TaxID=93504 RepID=UPI001040D170|nr:uncharacterized protein LOC114356372 [Ostrinia furnacalis]XP_028165300.1 uncharacterized protein LOC114356372 [Ostrinia furnacalis]